MAFTHIRGQIKTKHIQGGGNFSQAKNKAVNPLTDACFLLAGSVLIAIPSLTALQTGCDTHTHSTMLIDSTLLWPTTPHQRVSSRRSNEQRHGLRSPMAHTSGAALLSTSIQYKESAQIRLIIVTPHHRTEQMFARGQGVCIEVSEMRRGWGDRRVYLFAHLSTTTTPHTQGMRSRVNDRSMFKSRLSTSFRRSSEKTISTYKHSQ